MTLSNAETIQNTHERCDSSGNGRWQQNKLNFGTLCDPKTPRIHSHLYFLAVCKKTFPASLVLLSAEITSLIIMFIPDR